MNTFASAFRTARSRMTQEQAAQAIGCPVSTVRDWEQGRHAPPAWVQALVLCRIRSAKQ